MMKNAPIRLGGRVVFAALCRSTDILQSASACSRHRSDFYGQHNNFQIRRRHVCASVCVLISQLEAVVVGDAGFVAQFRLASGSVRVSASTDVPSYRERVLVGSLAAMLQFAS